MPKHVWAFLLLLPAWVVAQSTAPEPVAHYPGLSIQLSQSSPTGNIALGANITLQVAFSSRIRDRYERTAPLRAVRVVVNPTGGWHDPLAKLHALPIVHGGSFLSSIGRLQTEPIMDLLRLNDYVRFDYPGNYTIALIIGEVSEIQPGRARTRLVIITDPIKLRIVPAPPGWRDAQMVVAQTLGLGRLKSDVLAALGGPRAAALLARACVDDQGGCVQPIAETGAPQAAIPVLEQALIDPQRPVTDGSLVALAELQLLVTGGNYQDQFTINRQITQRLASALPYKTGDALVRSLAAILEFDPRAIPIPDRENITNQLAEHLEDLAPDERNWVMTNMAQPDCPLAGPFQLALVRRAALAPATQPYFDAAKAAALHRWYDLAPVEARPEVIRAVANDLASADWLGFLPDKVLAQADQPLLLHLSARPYTAEASNAASLIARYASPAIAGAVAGMFGQRATEWPCDQREQIIAYLQRTAPDLAAPLRTQVVECYRNR